MDTILFFLNSRRFYNIFAENSRKIKVLTQLSVFRISNENNVIVIIMTSLFFCVIRTRSARPVIIYESAGPVVTRVNH